MMKKCVISKIFPLNEEESTVKEEKDEEEFTSCSYSRILKEQSKHVEKSQKYKIFSQ